MPTLQPAGVVRRLFSALFPQPLQVQIRTEQLADGRIALEPVYVLAGQEVSPALVGTHAKQRILGYSVVADPAVLAACRQGPTTLPKSRAAKYLHDLQQNGVPVAARADSRPRARTKCGRSSRSV